VSDTAQAMMMLQIVNANLLKVHEKVIKKATRESFEFNANEERTQRATHTMFMMQRFRNVSRQF
jgi:hypothetical protein